MKLARAAGTIGLRSFQDAFAKALQATETTAAGGAVKPAEIARLTAQPGFAVYRNTVLKACVDALQANYPTVSRLVGDEWFRAAATIHARSDPPRHPMLVDYGAGFADFLAQFGPAAELPYLAGVARLDRLWTEAHLARDETPVAAAVVARLDAAELARATLRPHASARWAWFDAHPVASIWQRNRGSAAVIAAQDGPECAFDWTGEGMLIVRPYAEVDRIPLTKAGCAFLDACAVGGTLANAAAAALAADIDADLADIMARALAAGAFGQLILRTDPSQGNP